MKKKERIIKEREIGASLPQDLRKEYKSYLFKEQMKDFARKVDAMEAMKESIKNEQDDFKTSLKSPVEIDHEKAQRNVNIKRDEFIDKKIADYIEQKGLNVKDVKVVTKSGNIQLMYVNESGEIIREDIDVDKLQEK